MATRLGASHVVGRNNGTNTVEARSGHLLQLVPASPKSSVSNAAEEKRRARKEKNCRRAKEQADALE
jgi:hypothetical protein